MVLLSIRTRTLSFYKEKCSANADIFSLIGFLVTTVYSI